LWMRSGWAMEGAMQYDFSPKIWNDIKEAVLATD
jgi:hypothetical protein